MRCWIVIPADSSAKLAKGAELGADVAVVDFNLPESTSEGTRAAVRDWLETHAGHASGFQRWVRIRPVTAPQWREDLVAAMEGKPDGVIMPGPQSTDEVRRLASEIYELEQRNGMTTNQTRLVLQLGTGARAALAVHELVRDPNPRCLGFTWDPKALADDIRLGGSRVPSALAKVRDEVLLGAKSQGLLPIEAHYANWRDTKGFRAALERARDDGFEAMFAIHPAQVEAIRETFAPDDIERTEAEAIVKLFDGSPEADVLTHRGRMVDRAKLAQARRRLER